MEFLGELSQGRRSGPVVEPFSTSLGGRYVLREYQLVLHQYMIVDRLRNILISAT